MIKHSMVSMFLGGALLAVTAWQAAQAEPYLPSDPRALGMGGASTATARGPNSVLYNPALASPSMRRYRTGFSGPTLGFSLADREDFVGAYDDFDDSNVIDRIEDDIRAFNDTFQFIRGRIDAEEYETIEELEADISLIASDLSAVDITRAELEERVMAMSDKPLTFELKASAAYGGQLGQWGTGAYIQSRVYGGASFILDPQDFGLVSGAFDQAANIVSCLEEAAEGSDPDQSTLEFCRDQELPDEQTSEEFLSEFQAQGARLNEYGVTLARDFYLAGRDVAFGVTPKIINVATYDYQVRVQDEDSVAVGDRERSHGNSFNVDVGVAMQLRDDMRLGATIRNLIPESFETVEGNEIELDPQVRLGFSWDRQRFSLAADLDLTENAPMGFGPDTRFLALGGEYRPLNWLHLRGGYRFNLASSDIIDDVASVGFGISPGPIRLDFGLAQGSREAAAYMQFGMEFGSGAG